jgi:4-phytase / acid phosphatase
MHERIPLGPDEPPLSAPVFIPDCSEAGPAYDCPLDGFQRVMGATIDPAFAGPA